MYAIYIRGRRFCDLIMSGEKILETRNSPTLDRFIGSRVGIILTGCGKPKLIGTVNIGPRICLEDVKTFREYEPFHRVLPGSRYDIKDVKYAYLLTDSRKLSETELEPVKGNRIWREIEL